MLQRTVSVPTRNGNDLNKYRISGWDNCFFTVADARGGFRPPSDGECENVRAGLLTAISYLMQLEEMPRQQAAAYLKQL